MGDNAGNPTDLGALLAPHGLRPFGDCQVDDQTLTLIGPDEPRFWPIFVASPEYADGAPDPLDRWSARIICDVAQAIDGKALFPFGGPPYEPFFTWAVQSGQAWPSPIGFLVHAEAGLFVSFRGAIRWDAQPRLSKAAKPCLTCTHKPCATACPVGAFNDGYDVAACKSHVTSEAGSDCRTGGCLARRACPIGQGNRLPAQAAFHMEAFL